MKERLVHLAYPAATAVVIVIGWLIATEVVKVPNYILPGLGQIGAALWRGYVQGEFWVHLLFTTEALVIGYIAGAALGIALGTLVSESEGFERALYPYVVALQSMPKVALAPLVIVWFGFGIESKIVLVALICFFPIFVNTVSGIRSVDADLIDLMRVFGRSRLDILLEVKLPHAASAIMAGMQIGVVLGLIGAVAGEFIASTRGLGFLIQNAASSLDLGVVFAALLSLSAVGITGTQLLRLAQRRLIFWESRTAVDVESA
ncbi:MAG: ABC transporter permease [Betaproteobacteria bacterium]|nr:ABC transporter permease [Betaproteobacteria bacterium]